MIYAQHIRVFLKEAYILGVPGWHSRLGVQLLVSAQVRSRFQVLGLSPVSGSVLSSELA